MGAHALLLHNVPLCAYMMEFAVSTGVRKELGAGYMKKRKELDTQPQTSMVQAINIGQ